MLTPAHRHMLEVDSAIKPEVIEARGYKSVTSESPELDPFGKSQRRPGLLLPSYDLFAQALPGQLRPDIPRVTKDPETGKERELKYEGPYKSKAYIDCHPLILDRVKNTNEALIITEGVKKADSAITAGFLCLALLGVWSWRGKRDGTGPAALPDWDQLPMQDRKIVIAYDNDVLEKGPVKHAVNRLASYLSRHGSIVYIADWGRL